VLGVPPPSGVVLLDLDGVLVDSRAAITGAMRAALDEHGLGPFGAGALEALIGPPLLLAVGALLEAEPDGPVVTSVVASYRARYAITSLTETTVVPGIPAALADLAARRRLALATSKPRRYAEPILDALGLRPHLSAVGAAEDDGPGAEKAAVVAGALAALGADRGVLVGDRRFDVEGAHAHGLAAIGATWGIGTADELTAAGADALCAAPAALPPLALALSA
jgi:phosphoglycolate phosphatase